MVSVGASSHERLVGSIQHALQAVGDPERAVQQQAYMKSAMPYRGVPTDGVRRIVAAEIDRPAHRLAERADWEAAVLGLWDAATHREERYAAIAIARHRAAHRFRADGALGMYRYLVATGAWWDLVDEVATHLVRDELLAAPERVAPDMRAWAHDDDLWVRRTAILSQIGTRERVDLDLLADVIEPNLERSSLADESGRHDFFIRKAIGWALRDAARRHPDWVRAYVGEHRDRMAGLTVREAFKHLADR